MTRHELSQRHEAESQPGREQCPGRRLRQSHGPVARPLWEPSSGTDRASSLSCCSQELRPVVETICPSGDVWVSACAAGSNPSPATLKINSLRPGNSLKGGWLRATSDLKQGAFSAAVDHRFPNMRVRLCPGAPRSDTAVRSRCDLKWLWRRRQTACPITGHQPDSSPRAFTGAGHASRTPAHDGWTEPAARGCSSPR